MDAKYFVSDPSQIRQSKKILAFFQARENLPYLPLFNFHHVL